MKPWLLLPAELSQKLSPLGLSFFCIFTRQRLTPKWNEKTLTLPQRRSLVFKNPLGIAGGVDKSGIDAKKWEKLGAGFLEIGTVTLRPQEPNPGKIIDRNLKLRAVWNKMGFPSLGADAVRSILNQTHFDIPLFINIGKNRSTPNELAHEDYVELITLFKDTADAFVVNISSPNTQGLRHLADETNLNHFLKPIVAHRQATCSETPLLLKLSPDHDPNDLKRIIQLSIDLGIDGFIVTNTTLSRPSPHNPFPTDGGMSGKPLKRLSIQALKQVLQVCNEQKVKKIVISAGGVMTAEDVFERIDMGADLVQVYSTLIFEGPLFFRKVAEVVQKHTSRFIAKSF